jgi:hypothetical protein
MLFARPALLERSLGKGASLALPRAEAAELTPHKRAISPPLTAAAYDIMARLLDKSWTSPHLQLEEFRLHAQSQ